MSKRCRRSGKQCRVDEKAIIRILRSGLIWVYTVCPDHSVQNLRIIRVTLFVPINAPGALQVTGPKNDVLETKYMQNIHSSNVLKAFYRVYVAFGHLFLKKLERAFIRDGAFIRNKLVISFFRLAISCCGHARWY